MLFKAVYLACTVEFFENTALYVITVFGIAGA